MSVASPGQGELKVSTWTPSGSLSLQPPRSRRIQHAYDLQPGYLAVNPGPSSDSRLGSATCKLEPIAPGLLGDVHRLISEADQVIGIGHVDRRE